jgi:hypothetical protein
MRNGRQAHRRLYAESAARREPAPGNSLAPGDPAYPQAIPITLEAITFTSQGIPFRTERTTLVARPVGDGPTRPPRAASAPDEAGRGFAAKLLALLTALDPDKRLRKAAPVRVFNLYYRQRLEPAEIARRCKCHRSLVFDRLAAIQKALPWTPQQLHELSPHVEALQEALSDSRASGIHRKSAVYGDGVVDGESD